MSIDYRQRGSSLARTLVVASSTLAILLVCFSIYQYGQVPPTADAPPRAPRLPSPPTEPVGYRSDNGDEPGVEIGQGVIGAGERTQITIYPRDGNQALAEIEVLDWTPAPGSGNEFLLSEPDVRMRTNDGHAVRITAKRGKLEARQRDGGGLDPRRGRLSGNVVIQYDRLSEKQRAALPPERRDRIDPAELVRIETEEIEFDLEYSKLLAPGRLVLSASDVRLDASNLEIRFNEAANRIEHLRISHGGTLELLDRGGGMGMSLPGLEDSSQNVTVAQWLYASLQAGLRARMPAKEATPAADPTPAPTPADEVPVFRTDAAKEDQVRPPIRYYARFDGDVDARQLAGGSVQSHLQADSLEIVRDVSNVERDQSEAVQRGQTALADAAVAATDDRVILTWADTLVVEPCGAEDDRCAGQSRSQITATGTPVRLTHAEGEATAHKLIFDPEDSSVRLSGSGERAAVVSSAGQGRIVGLEIHSYRRGDEFFIEATGPGELVSYAVADVVGRTPSNDRASGDQDSQTSRVSFADRMAARGHVVTERGLDSAGRVYSREVRLLDSAEFRGLVRMAHDDVALEGDVVSMDFGTRRRGLFGHEQTLERVHAQGHVSMLQGEDSISCREIEIQMQARPGGGTMPRVATAWGDVSARQGERTITAREKLIVDFEPIVRVAVASGEGERAAESDVVGGGTSGSETTRGSPEPAGAARTEAGVSRLRAFGEVSVTDASQGFEVTAETLDCAVVNGSEIDTAVVEGAEGQPAAVRLDTFTITGARIKLNVREQWAEVPGGGRLTFRSQKDLDGSKSAEPIPVVITWQDWMRYRGDKNRAVFSGRVHATSQSTTTFDCQRLEVYFDDVPVEDAAQRGGDGQWKIVREMARRIPLLDRALDREQSRRFNKEVAYLEASGNAVALTSEIDAATRRVISRTRISGPKLWVNLRPEVRKMMIEGPGNLLVEDYRPQEDGRQDGEGGGRVAPRASGGLFAVGQNGGPSTTLIEWEDLMWYDFSVKQTRFEGKVSLKHFSGSELDRIRGRKVDASGGGRSTFLTGDVLTVDFLDREKRSRTAKDDRLGLLSSRRLSQFQASGSVVLQDQSEGLSVTADRIVYWKDRQVLAIFGSPRRKAHIVKQRVGRLPHQVSVEHLFYNLTTGEWELARPAIRTR